MMNLATSHEASTATRAVIARQPDVQPTPPPKRVRRRASLDIHRLYHGAMAKPVPGSLAHFAGMAAVVGYTGVRASPLAVVPELVTGFFAWTLFEYGLHRWILHSKNPVLWRVLHKGHHGMRTMEDPTHRLMHPIVAVPMMGGVTLLFARLGGAPLIGVGFWVGYLAYELIHWVHHDTRLTKSLSRFAYFRRRVVFHHAHHFRRADTHYGFTIGLWDHVFGTSKDAEQLAAITERELARGRGELRQ